MLTEPGPECVRFADLDRDPVNVQDSLVGQRGDPAARHQDADQVQGVGDRDQDRLLSVPLAPDGSERFDGLRQRELFPGEPLHEPAAADLSARLQPPVDPE